MFFSFFICCLIALRLGELAVARRNEKWLRNNGAREYGKGHYPYMVLLHVCLIVSLIIEYLCKDYEGINGFLLILFILLILFKMYVISSLGRYWNTKILRIPGAPLVKKGVYKFFKHPNYAIVVCEIAIIPLIFHLYVTALLFSVLNALMLSVRISEENKVLV